MYVFLIIMVMLAAGSVAAVSYMINVSQIDGYFKRLAQSNADNFASFTDAEFLKKDPLTGVGNKASYIRKVEGLNEEIREGTSLW
ncbi:MAG: hypothetical protein IJ600_02980 [Lachnospiraceae bacterium]|nr:hypothetical protein [Lachnospiraceae bacterium]